MRVSRDDLGNLLLGLLFVVALVLGATCAVRADGAEDRWRAGIGSAGVAADSGASANRASPDGVAVNSRPVRGPGRGDIDGNHSDPVLRFVRGLPRHPGGQPGA